MNTYTFTNIMDHKQYTVAARDNVFILQDDTTPAGLPCKHCIKVKPDHEFCYKIQKTQIKANGGAAGLVDFIRECYEKKILESAVNKIIQAIMSGAVKSF